MKKKKEYVKIPYEDMMYITACLDVFQAVATNNGTYKLEADKACDMVHNGGYEIIKE